MNKSKKALLAILSMVATTAFFAGCSFGGETPHEHNYAQAKYDETNHWNECECGEKEGVEAHTYEEKYDETNHWQECVCGDVVDSSVATHTYEEKYDETNHWQECTCGSTVEIVAHTYEAKYDETNHWQECTCGSKIELAEHTFETKYDENNHWQECACGAKKEVAEHTYETKHGVNGHWEECACGSKISEEAHDFTNGDCDCGKKVITLEKTAISLTGGATETLVATTNEGYTVTWTSSNTAVATVDSTGKVTAIAMGEAEITASDGATTATCTVKVTSTVYTLEQINGNSSARGQWSGGFTAGKDLREWAEDETYGKVLKWTSSGGSTGFYCPRLYFLDLKSAAACDYVSFTLKVVPAEGFETAATTAKITLQEALGTITNDADKVTYASEVSDWTTVTFDKKNNSSAFANMESSGLGICIYTYGAAFDCYVYLANVEIGVYDNEEEETKVTYEGDVLNSLCNGAAGQYGGGVSAGKSIYSMVEDATYGKVLKWTSSGSSGYYTPRMQFKIPNASEYDYVKFTVKLTPYEGFEAAAATQKIYISKTEKGVTENATRVTYASELSDWTTVTFSKSKNPTAFADFASQVIFVIYCNANFDCDVYFASIEFGYYDEASAVYSDTSLKAVTNGAAGQLLSGISEGKDVREWVTDEKYGTVLKWTSSGNAGMYTPRMQFNFSDASKYDYVRFTLKIEAYSADDETAAKTKKLGISKYQGAGVTNDADGVTYASDVADWTTVTFDKVDNAAAFAEFDTYGIVPIVIYCNDGLFNCYVYIAQIEFGYYN